jgi:hypothetical protein
MKYYYESPYLLQLELLGIQDKINILINDADKAGDDELKAYYIGERAAVNTAIHRISKMAGAKRARLD